MEVFEDGGEGGGYQDLQPLQQASGLSPSHSNISTGTNNDIEDNINHEGQNMAENHQEPQSLQQESELSPSHSNVSAKTNNDNEDNNNMISGETPMETRPELGRNRRVRQKNRYFEDFHCMNLKKGGRSREDYEIFSSPSLCATTKANRNTNSSNKRSTTESNNRETQPASTIDPDKPVADLDSGLAAEPTEYLRPRHCRKCSKRTLHDMNRKCQVCLYKKIVSTSKRQETLRLKAQASKSDGGEATLADPDPAAKQDNNNDAGQSLATSASSSVAHTPTSLDGALVACGGESDDAVCGGGPTTSNSASISKNNKRKAKNQGGRASKQPPAVAASAATALSTVHDTDEETDMVLDTNHDIKPTIENASVNDQEVIQPVAKDDRARDSEGPVAQDNHNSSGSSDATADTNTTVSRSSTTSSSSIPSRGHVSNLSTSSACTSTTTTTTGSSSGSSTSTSIGSHVSSLTSSSASSTCNTTSDTTTTNSTSNTSTGTSSGSGKQATTSSLKLTTTLKTDEKGKKRWVVTSSGPSSQKDETQSAPVSSKSQRQVERKHPPKPISNNDRAEQPLGKISNPTIDSIAPVDDAGSTGARDLSSGDIQQDEVNASKIPKSEPDEPVAQADGESSDNKSAQMDKNNGTEIKSSSKSSDISRSKGNKSDSSTNQKTNSIQTNGDETQGQPQLTKVDAWTPDEVAQYVSSRGFSIESELFKSQAVDGMSLLLMKRTDFTHGLKMKLGPALKLFDQVCKLKREYFSLSASAS